MTWTSFHALEVPVHVPPKPKLPQPLRGSLAASVQRYAAGEVQSEWGNDAGTAAATSAYPTAAWDEEEELQRLIQQQQQEWKEGHESEEDRRRRMAQESEVERQARMAENRRELEDRQAQSQWQHGHEWQSHQQEETWQREPQERQQEQQEWQRQQQEQEREQQDRQIRKEEEEKERRQQMEEEEWNRQQAESAKFLEQQQKEREEQRKKTEQAEQQRQHEEEYRQKLQEDAQKRETEAHQKHQMMRDNDLLDKQLQENLRQHKEALQPLPDSPMQQTWGNPDRNVTPTPSMAIVSGWIRNDSTIFVYRILYWLFIGCNIVLLSYGYVYFIHVDLHLNTLRWLCANPKRHDKRLDPVYYVPLHLRDLTWMKHHFATKIFISWNTYATSCANILGTHRDTTFANGKGCCPP